VDPCERIGVDGKEGDKDGESVGLSDGMQRRSAGGGCLEDGGVIDGKSDGKLHVRGPRKTGVDGTSIGAI